MAQVLFDGFIGKPGQSQDVFFDNQDQTKVRVLSAEPINPPPFDQQAELEEVYYILKGTAHGPQGGANSLQLHTVVQNKQGGAFDLHPPFLFYRVLVSEL